VHVNTTFGHECDTTLGISGLVLREELELVVFDFEVADISVTAETLDTDRQEGIEDATYPLPARYNMLLLSSQNGMQTPEMESRVLKPLMGSRTARICQRAS
jgi:hypothetical protein